MNFPPPQDWYSAERLLKKWGESAFGYPAHPAYLAYAGRTGVQAGAMLGYNRAMIDALGTDHSAVEAALEEWRTEDKPRRLWGRDRSLWTNADEDRWLGWLHVVDGQRDDKERLRRIVDDVKRSGFRHAVLLGMGGSSLCPEVLARTFGRIDGFPELLVLDSTVPAQIHAIESRIDLSKTLFIVSSKSGTTTETQALKRYFFEKLADGPGRHAPGSHFVAITDPGTPLHRMAKEEGFRYIVHGIPSIGGRYSALSNFGMVPAAIVGVDAPAFLDRAEIMVRSCASSVPAEANPGTTLGVTLGILGARGRDKVTIVASPAIGSLGAWLEQLLAESTGKKAKGLIPVDDEKLGPPEVYGKDRLFVYMRLNSAASQEQDRALETLERAGHPVVRIALEDAMDLGQEFFRWEIATAAAGSVLGINPFDQPDVEASKVATRKLTVAFEESGRLPKESPILSDGGIRLFADPNNAAVLRAGAAAESVEEYLAAHLRRLGPGDYFAVNAYLERNEANQKELQSVRHAVRDAKLVATTLGYGPRFLHSTGQLHKGGPNTGVFLQITAEDARDISIPGQKYTFGLLKRFQAQGDFAVLAQRRRRLLRVHLGADVKGGLARLREIVARALARA